MSRWKSFVMVVAVLLLHHHHQTCDAITNTNNQTYCPPSSCGKITNITHPFRLMNDPTSCGDPKYELSCENNITVLTLFSGKYYVKSINYNNYTIRLVDPGIQEGNCSSLPRYFLSSSNLTYFQFYDVSDNDTDPYQMDDRYYDLRYGYIIYFKCSKQVNDDPEYVDTAPCINSDSKSYLYAFAADFWKNQVFSVGRLKDYCQVKLVAMSSFDFPSDVREGVPDEHQHRPLSYKEIHGMLLYGFQLSWMSGACRDSCRDNQQCFWNYTTREVECYNYQYHCEYPLGNSVNKRCGKKYCFFFNFRNYVRIKNWIYYPQNFN